MGQMVWSTVSSDISDSLAGISDFSKDIVSEMGSDSDSISSHDGGKSDTGSDYNSEPRHQQFLHPSIEKSRVVATCILQETVIIKLIIII